MHLSLRTKLTLIVGATAFALSSVTVLSLRLGAQQSRALEDLEQRLVPKLELETRLLSQFEQLGQALKDAVAARERSGLLEADALRDALAESIVRAGPALEPGAADALRVAVERYHRSARHVSERLLEGEGGEPVVAEMAAMQVLHQRTVDAIERFARIDRATLRSGFAAVHAASQRAARTGAALGLLSLALIVGLSTWLVRRALERLGQQRDAADWVKAGQVALTEQLHGALSPAEVAQSGLTFLADRVGAQAGALFLEQSDTFELVASYAMPDAVAQERRFALGEGLVGQAALRAEPWVVEGVPPGYLEPRAGLGQSAPRCLLLVPLRRGSRAIGVLELALPSQPTEPARELLGLVSEGLAVALDSARSRARLGDLLEQSQTLAARLAAQEEELVQRNRALNAGQEELRLANETLEAQRTSLRQRNGELEQARQSLQEQADQLAQMSSYKSQFLANMSHELRTPLNSMLLLSQILAGNEAGNLEPKQVEHCRAIHRAGKGLLSLINQVLDLSKIEAGKQELDVTRVATDELASHLGSTFGPQFEDKGIAFEVNVAPEVPASFFSDGPCLQRILINLLGNALKFTERGRVSLTISRPAPGTRFERDGLTSDNTLAFAVRDTGIGIAADLQSRVFARFEQGDARTVRRYGGTGLGLAIARESALLLGGELQLESVEGEGSTFTCILPERLPRRSGRPPPAAPHATGLTVVRAPEGTMGSVANGKRSVERGAEQVQSFLGRPSALQKGTDGAALAPAGPSVLNGARVLIADDDMRTVYALSALLRERGADVIVAETGREALRVLDEHGNVHAVLMDVMMPDMDGYEAMRKMRQHPQFARLPVIALTARPMQGEKERCEAAGASEYMAKPVDPGGLLASLRFWLERAPAKASVS
jgi:signal transduction histidine kinase/ActR/RegA family two-component response regulator